jgi:hypothetical protein
VREPAVGLGPVAGAPLKLATNLERGLPDLFFFKMYQNEK